MPPIVKPSMNHPTEVRFEHLSLAADIAVADETEAEALPTLANAVTKAVHRLSVKKHQVTKAILSDVSGVFKPGTMTLVLGQPGSGKSALMRLLSGTFPMTKRLRLDGEMTLNGININQGDIRRQLPQVVAYVTEDDQHYATLSTKETLEFARACCGGPEAQDVVQQLGLEGCQDTILGDAMLRGVSGGERKRVTIGEMQFGEKQVILMDEITTGLDSAAAFDIVNMQRRLAKIMQRTVVMALLQPSPEIFELFDQVLLLNAGRVIYHGPCSQVLGYFETLGFQCPPSRDTADYLLDIGTHQQHQYEAAAVAQASKYPRRAREFAECFAQSSLYQDLMTDLHAPFTVECIEGTKSHLAMMPPFTQSRWQSFKTLLSRQLKITYRNTAFIRGRVGMTLMALIYGSMFWQFDVTNAQVVLGMTFAAVLFYALGQASQVAVFFGARNIYYKQRSANFYRTSTFVITTSVSQLPLALFETIGFGTIVYWMCGYVRSFGAFITFELLLFLTDITFAAWFFFLSCIAPDIHVAKPATTLSIMIFILFGGFVILSSQIPRYLVWIYWIDPIAWASRALAVNEYQNSYFSKPVFDGVNYYALFGKNMGTYSLELFDIQSGRHWIWLGFAFLLFAYAAFLSFACLALEHIRYESPDHVRAKEDDICDNSDTARTTSSNIGDYDLMHTPTSSSEMHLALPIAETIVNENIAPVTLAFKNLRYSVVDPQDANNRLELLKGINGYALPGKITALMGSTGAGKTTLMDVIAGRKTEGDISGDILLNGFPATSLSIRRSTGYCEQMDIHSEASTFREALTFSAFLRQDANVPASSKLSAVEECLDLLDLRPIADQIVRGSFIEQLKRLTIGVELAAHPSILFLDEPTSGLDARSAKIIMDGVRKVADTGRTVVCTIHQPSAEVFQVFDSLLLLKIGGETVFFGDLGQNASELVNYLESVAGVVPIKSEQNPAAWMLEVIGAGVEHAHQGNADFVGIFQCSTQHQTLEAMLAQEGIGAALVGSSPLQYCTKRASSSWTQFRFLISRFVSMYWRTPSYNMTRLASYTVLGFVFGLSFLGADYKTYQGVMSGMGMTYCALIFVGLLSSISVLSISYEDRAAFYRERASETYNTLWYFLSCSLVEIPYVLVATLIFTSFFFPLVGFTGFHRFVLYWMNTVCYVLVQTYLGQLMAFALPRIEVAAVVSGTLNSLFFLTMGFNPPASIIPRGYKWLYHITPAKYSLSIFASLVFGDCPADEPSALGCQVVHNIPPTMPQHLNVKEVVATIFSVKYDEIAQNWVILIAFIFIIRILGLLALRFINHQKR